ncbi:DctP family TRAP transporter solute-binding subunit [Oceanobacillus sp. CAU 1775]
MRKLLLIFASVMLLLVLAACGDDDDTSSNANDTDDTSETDASNEDTEASGDAEFTIRASIGLNADHPQYDGLLKFKEIVEAETDGAVFVETYHSGQLGDDRTAMEALQLGSQEVTVPSTAPVANFVPEFALFDIPFLMPSSEVADEVLDGEVGQKMLDLLEDQNLVGLAYWENGYRDMSNSVRPIETMEDFKGLTLRTMENDLHLSAFSALGANPTPMAFTELFTALQQGTVDGQENPIATIYLEGFHEVQDYVSATNHIYTPFVFLVSKPFFDGLPEEYQEVLRSAAVEAGVHQREVNRKANEEYVQSLIDEGVEFTEVSDEAKAEMREAVQPVIDEFAEELGSPLFDELYDAIEAAQ